MNNQYDYNIDEIKEKLTIEQVADILGELGGEPIIHDDFITARTICHNGDSHKLYYYDNTHLFHCYTGCSEPSFDLFELVLKIKKRQNANYQLPSAVQYVASYFGFTVAAPEEFHEVRIEDWTILNKYDKIKNKDNDKQVVELKTYDASFLNNLPKPAIQPWIEEGITKEVMDLFDIRYDPKNCGIVIPHYDLNGNIIGIRERIMDLDTADKYGKYLPMKVNKKMYNHPLSFSLYGLYQNKDTIAKLKKAIVFEGEKSVMLYGSIFGQENNIAVACCGSNFIKFQCQMLIDLGVEEIIIALDKQYQKLGDDEHLKLVRNLKQIHKKYGHYVKISYLFDTGEVIGYKDSPIDKGKDAFIELYKGKVNLY